MIDDDGKLHFFLNDHLGSARVVFDATRTVEDTYRYYAYGASSEQSVSTNQAYRYTGKPFDDESNLDLYYYGARYYDPATGRFISVDPLRGKYPSWSPYVYTLDNPLKYIDPDGRGLRELIKNPRVRAISSLGASLLADYASNHMEPGKARGAVRLVAGALATHAAAQSAMAATASYTAAVTTAPTVWGTALGGLVGTAFAAMAATDLYLAQQYVADGLKDLQSNDEGGEGEQDQNDEEEEEQDQGDNNGDGDETEDETTPDERGERM